ncbi:DegT/DnrJ/EryC1/StrS family aminotransferase, partial [Acidobacteriota bacterium]
GGLVVTSNDQWAEAIRTRGNHGEKEKNRHGCLGRTSRLDTIQAAVLRVKLKHIEAWNERRRKLAVRYNELFQKSGLSSGGIGPMASNPIVPPTVAANRDPIFYLYTIRAYKRDALTEHLSSSGVGWAVHYPIPAYRQECVEESYSQAFNCPVTEEACREVVSIPLYPEMTEAQQEYVVESIRRFYESGR